MYEHLPHTAELDPEDRLYAAIIRQAIADYQTGLSQRRPATPASYSFMAARAFLLDLGLLDDAGDVAVTEWTAV